MIPWERQAWQLELTDQAASLLQPSQSWPGLPHRNEAEERKRELHIPEGTTRERELMKKSLCSTLVLSS